MLGKWLLRVIRNAEKGTYGPPEYSMERLSNALHHAPVVTVFQISNGFVLVQAADMQNRQAVVYCKEISEVGNQIITLQTRAAMGIPPNVAIGAAMSGSGSSGGSSLLSDLNNVPKQQQFQYPSS